ncbi:hypothetical protein IW150_005857, partial [Coemansia sp. RSA 2607]
MTFSVCSKCSTGFECEEWYHTHMQQIHGIDADGSSLANSFSNHREPPSTSEAVEQKTTVRRRDSILPAFLSNL